MLRVLVAMIAIPNLALAEDWVQMTGPEIQEQLTDTYLVYENATQRFYASGRTLYNNGGRDSWGYWAVRGDQYCSQWPPSDLWDCYDMAASPGQLRFIGSGGETTDGIIRAE